MASILGVLCIVLLSVSLSHAEKPSRLFEVKPGCVQDGVTYPVGASVPDEDPCTFGCFCSDGGNVICAMVRSPRSCAMIRPPCVDPEYVNDPDQCCPSLVCPNGPNCMEGGQIIPAGQTVNVNGAQCSCTGQGLTLCHITQQIIEPEVAHPVS